VKSNLLIVIAGAVCLFALILLGYVHLEGNSFINETSEAAKRKINQVRALTRVEARTPAENPDDPPRIDYITVNRPAISSLQNTFTKMENESREINKYALSINQKDHLPLRDNLFPDPDRSTAAAHSARYDYRDAFPEFFKENRLDAQAPPSAAEIDAERERAKVEFYGSNLLRSDANLSDSQAAALAQAQSRRVTDYLVRHAKETHLYSQPDPENKEFPFEIMPWAFTDRKPTARELWEAQMQLWIIQDICRAIAQTNRVSEAEVNVINAPVKRLIDVTVLPDYVGITGKGGMDQNGPGARAQAGSGAPRPEPTANTGQPAVAHKAGAALNEKLPDDFTLAPTGRRSNALYDVRHAWVTIIADAQQLPTFFDNLAQTNFMTVLKMEVTDEDEYKAAQQGYIYGTRDSVRVQMLVETIWLRDWTTKFMPQSVLASLMPEAQQ